MKQNKKYFYFFLIFTFSCLSSAWAAKNHSRVTPIVKAFESAAPAVVNISTLQVLEKGTKPFGKGQKLPSLGDMPQTESSSEGKYLGSGVIINPEGYILTNEHVIAKGSTFRITLADQRKFDAIVQGADATLDLAILKIQTPNPTSLPQIRFGTSDDLLIGETVIAIGNPFGLSHTVTTGVISGISRSVKSGNQIFRDFIQIDAPIHPGNSGGPLLNINGELIGINTAVLENTYGIGFAIPINNAMRVVEDLINYGEVRGVWLGIALKNRKATEPGLLVSNVDPEGPAREAGFILGDILFSVDGKPVNSQKEFIEVIRSYTAGNMIPLELNRNGKPLNVEVMAQEFPLNRSLALSRSLLGLSVIELTSKKIRRYKVKTNQGALVRRVFTGSPAAQMGIQTGDVIRQVNSQEIINLEEYKKAIIKVRQKSSVLLLIQRGNFGYYLTLRLS